MTTPAHPDPDRGPAPRGRSGAARGWLATASIGLIAAATYLANGREIGAFDTIPTTLLPLSILRGDGLHLDRFRPLLRRWGTPFPGFVAESGGHVISSYPIGPALVALPLIAPQVMALDSIEPGWDRDPRRAFSEARKMAKRAAAVLAALAAVVLHRLLLGLGLRRVASAATLAAALGTGLWSVASQALWQHGPAALFLSVTLLLLLSPCPSRVRMLLAGTSTAMMVAMRGVDVVFAIVVLAWIARACPRCLAWFLPVPVILGLALVAYHLYFFGNLTGGQERLERLHRRVHAVGGAWSGDLRAGMAGTLFSPNRGLLVFSPWVAVAIATLPVSIRKLPPGSLPRWLMPALVLDLLVLSKYAVWWGGGSFGPRYWTDASPILAVMLACGLDWARERSRALVVALAATILFSIAVQAVGAFCFPSTWNYLPNDTDLHHERFWDWRDSEVLRCLGEWCRGQAPLRPDD